MMKHPLADTAELQQLLVIGERYGVKEQLGKSDDVQLSSDIGGVVTWQTPGREGCSRGSRQVQAGKDATTR